MKVGDLVSFLDESGEGEIIDIDGNTILVDVQGFQKSYDISEIIKREQGFENKIINSQVINKDVSVSTKVKRAIDSEVFVVDLHASAIPNFRNQLKGHNILLFQMETAKNHLESARKNRLKKMIFIIVWLSSRTILNYIINVNWFRSVNIHHGTIPLLSYLNHLLYLYQIFHMVMMNKMRSM